MYANLENKSQRYEAKCFVFVHARHAITSNYGTPFFQNFVILALVESVGRCFISSTKGYRPPNWSGCPPPPLDLPALLSPFPRHEVHACRILVARMVDCESKDVEKEGAGKSPTFPRLPTPTNRQRETWLCPLCTYANDTDDDECDFCDEVIVFAQYRPATTHKPHVRPTTTKARGTVHPTTTKANTSSRENAILRVANCSAMFYMPIKPPALFRRHWASGRSCVHDGNHTVAASTFRSLYSARGRKLPKTTSNASSNA